VTQSVSTRVLSDTGLTRRAAGGNQRAFEAIFERYHRDLYRYCAAILGNAEDAHDAVQNTMLKVLRSLPGETREIKLKPWLYRIAHNEAIDLLRARRSTEPIDAESLVGRGGPANEVEARERLRLLVADIAELPDRQRSALVMRELSGLSYEQIAEALETSAAVARQTLYEARVSLGQMSGGREMQCQEVMRAVSDEDGRRLRRRDIRAHLRSCESCRAFEAGISNRRRELAAVAPLPALASAGILQSLLGGGAGGSSGAVGGAGAVGAGAGKALAGTAAVKTAAAICAVAAIGVVAADKGGVIDLGSGNRQGPPAGTTSRPTHAPGNPASTTSPQGSRDAGVGGAGRAGQGSGQTGNVWRASAVQSRPGAANGEASPATTQVSPDEAPGPNGRHLGHSKGSSQAGGRGKTDHPAKGKKASPPGQAKNQGKAKHAAGGKSGAEKQPEARPPHPSHPAHSEHTPSPPTATSPAADPGAATEAGNGAHGKAPPE
jgi:RNA polymerase sigma factor (sigma-70 family)